MYVYLAIYVQVAILVIQEYIYISNYKCNLYI